MELIVDVTCREGPCAQLGAVLELLHAFSGLYRTLGLLFATGVATGTTPDVADGKGEAVAPCASMHVIIGSTLL